MFLLFEHLGNFTIYEILMNLGFTQIFFKKRLFGYDIRH